MPHTAYNDACSSSVLSLQPALVWYIPIFDWDAASNIPQSASSQTLVAPMSPPRLQRSSSTLQCCVSGCWWWSPTCWYSFPDTQQSQTTSSIQKMHCWSLLDSDCSSCSKDPNPPGSPRWCSQGSPNLHGSRPIPPSSSTQPNTYGPGQMHTSSPPYRSWNQLLSNHSSRLPSTTES